MLILLQRPPKGEVNCSMPPKEEQERLREFANRVTPKNWNVCLEPKLFKLKPGTLNIFLDFYYRVYTGDEDDEDLCSVGETTNMIFLPASFWGGNGKGNLADIAIRLNAAYGGLEVTLLHELAHVAASRFIAFKDKIHIERPNKINRCGGGRVFSHYEDMHGETFQRTLVILVERVKGEFAKQIQKDDMFWKILEAEIEFFKGEKVRP